MINIFAIALLRWALQLGQVIAECIKWNIYDKCKSAASAAKCFDRKSISRQMRKCAN